MAALKTPKKQHREAFSTKKEMAASPSHKTASTAAPLSQPLEGLI
jgi:hypothetical protein